MQITVRVLVIYDDDQQTGGGAGGGSGDMIEQLGAAGFDVDAVSVYEDGIRRAITGHYALVVLDAHPTSSTGFEIVRRIRAESAVPVILLTGGEEVVDRIVGLEIGADDCLAKPCNTGELAARMRALLRRTQMRAREKNNENSDSTLSVGDLRIDPSSRTAACGGQRLDLTCAEFDLLEVLLRSAGRVVSREDLARIAFGKRITPDDRTIDVHISRLRRKLAKHSDAPDRIKTLRGTGYLCATGDGGMTTMMLESEGDVMAK